MEGMGESRRERERKCRVPLSRESANECLCSFLVNPQLFLFFVSLSLYSFKNPSSVLSLPLFLFLFLSRFFPRSSIKPSGS